MTNNNIKYTDTAVNEAAEWFIRLQDEAISDTCYKEWQEWLASSHENRNAFERAEKCWDILDNIAELPTITAITEKNDISNVRKLNPLRRIMPMVGSIAAAVTIIFSAGLFYQQNYLSAPETTTYQTARAEHKLITLDDGSKINLAARSIVNVNYTDKERNITLVRGEAVFDVAKNKHRPFIVKTRKGTATAVGTKFNIHSSDLNVTVTVLEGIVEVNPITDNNSLSAKPLPQYLTRITAGEAISYEDNGHISEVIKSNIDVATSWEKGLLVRVDTPLSSVIEDVNRYSSREIIIGDAALNDIRFTGTVLNDGIDNWLRGLSVAYPIKVLDSGHDAILLLKKTN